MIRQRRVWTRQPPPGTRIDWSNPLTKGLGVVVEGEHRRDAARSIYPAVDTAPAAPSAAGMGLGFDGTASFLHGYGSAPVSSGDMTLAALFVPNATGGIFGISSPASVTYGDQNLLLFNSTGPVVSVYSVRDSDGGLVEASINSPGIGVPQVAVGTFVAGGARSIYVRGASNSEGTGVSLSGFSQIAAGYVPVIGYILNGVVVRGLLWNRILAAHEITAILDNIWQIYEPQSLPRFTPAPISSGYTLTAQGGSYTLTGASATLQRNKYLIVQGGNYSLVGADAQISHNRNIAATGGTYAISGASAILTKHRYLFNSGGSYNITGASANLRKSKVILAQGGTYSLAGAQAILSKIRTLIAQGGSYSVTGASAALLKSRVIAAVGGVYGVAGAAAILKRGRLLTASGGSYTVGGAQASLARNRALTAQGGAYSFVGNSAVITYTGTAILYTLTAQGGSYSIGGASAVLQRSRLLIGQGGSYSLAGQTAILSRHRYIQGQGGSYSIVGQDAILLRSKVLVSQGGTYAVVGANAQIHRNRKLTASGGIYNYTGRSAVITYTGIGGVWPQPGEVLLGVQYGPNGNDYTGTLNAYGIKYDINTGRLVKPMTDLVVVSFGERA